MKLIARKFYIDVETDEWLEENFGAQRERSRAVDLALQDFRLKVEANRANAEIKRIDLGRLSS
jgi:hypothetical protein